MSKNILISIIIPVYNSKKYIRYCLNSIQRQSFEDFEVIIVDDGSNDGSEIIVDEYCKLDNRFRTIHKANEGVSIARNSGIKEVKGKYIAFCDSDDWLEKDALKNMFLEIEKYKADLIGGSKVYVWPHINKKSILVDKTYMSSETNSFLNDSKLFRSSVWGKLFKTDIIKNNKLEFNTNIKNYEDGIFSNEYLALCNKVVLSSKIVYYYNKLEDTSASNKYHKEINYWVYYYYLAQCKTIEKWIVDKDEQDTRKKEIADKLFNDVIDYYITKVKDINLSNVLIEETATIFKNVVTTNNKNMTKISNKDIDSIRNDRKASILSKILRKLIINPIKRILYIIKVSKYSY